MLEDRSYAKSLHRALSVLKCFNFEETELSGIEIARKVGIHKTTAYRILSTLCKDGMLIRNKDTHKYTIGRVLYTLGCLYLYTTTVFKAAEPVVKILSGLTNEDVNVGILNEGYITVILKEESRHRLKCSIHIGVIIPAYASAMGLALLAEMSDLEIEALYPEEKLRMLTPQTIATKKELKLVLQQIRKTGFSFHSGGGYEGVDGFGSVIRNGNGRAVAAISFSVPTFRMNPARYKKFGTLLKMGASLVSYKLGYHDEINPVRDIEEICKWWQHNQTDIASRSK